MDVAAFHSDGFCLFLGYLQVSLPMENTWAIVSTFPCSSYNHILSVSYCAFVLCFVITQRMSLAPKSNSIKYIDQINTFIHAVKVEPH